MTTQKFFNSGDLDVGFWKAYIAERPAPPESFLEQIIQYHEGPRDIAHDVGTGPGNIAARVAHYFSHVVGSDVNGQALAAAPHLIDEKTYKNMTFVQAPAEQLASGVVPEAVGVGKTDLVIVSECMPLLDPTTSVQAFHQLLRPGGTLAIYFYSRPLFADGNNAAECDALYDRIASKICTFIGPFVGVPAEAFWKRSVVALNSWLDNVEFATSDWTAVQRIKWNNDVPLSFNDPAAYGFDLEKIDNRHADETTSEVLDRTNWQKTYTIDDIRGYLNGVYPQWKKKASDRAPEVEPLLEELSTAMGGSRKVGFPVCLILARKK